ncbi:MAG: glycosyltransferase involved in cell wall biosynthesis [Candidatus Azotimanducaceae bacterium]|jgi:glycosyltransferase involved in cell wall biosynthesis
MSVFIFTNLIAGVSGLDKSAINTANLLADAGIDTHIINCVGADGGFRSVSPKFPTSSNVTIHSIQAMTTDGGNKLYTKERAAFKIRQERLTAKFTHHDLLVVREINHFASDSDLAIFTHPLQAVLFMRAIKGEHRKIKTMLQIHGNFAEEHDNRALLIESLSVIDSLQIVSKSMRAGICEISGMDTSSVHYIPNIHFPIEIERGIHKRPRIAIIGSLQDRKNQIDGVRAITKLENDNAILDIWGNAGTDYGKFMEIFVTNTELVDRVKFRGIGQENDIYKDTDIVIITSKHEGFGYTMIEAATHGIPTIAYNYDFGADDFIEDGINGHIVPLGDVQKLAECIDALISNPAKRDAFGVEAKNRFFRDFSPERILEMYKAVIPAKSENYGHNFTSHFLRNGNVPFHKDSLKIEHCRVLGCRIADKISVTPLDGEEFEFVKITPKGKIIQLRTRQDGAEIVGHIPKFSRRLRRLSPKGFIGTRGKDGTISYVCNYTLNGKVEWLAELSREGRRSNTSAQNTQSDIILAKTGPHLPYDYFESISKIYDEDGETCEFETRILDLNNSRKPYVNIPNGYKSVDIHYTSGQCVSHSRTSLSYKEIFNRLLVLEEEHQFLQFELGGIRPWELIRATLLEELMMYHGLWGQHFSPNIQIARDYPGKKLISEAPSADKILIEFARKADVDYRTLPLRTGNEIVIESPQTYGYTVDSYIDGPVYPLDEFTKKSARVTLASNQKYRDDLFGPIFKQTFGIDLQFNRIVEARILKFKKEYHFWSGIFAKTSFGEVIIPSSYWSAGIVHAARENGIKTSDIQYALMTPMHPINHFTQKALYTPDRLYAWSDYWAQKASKYSETLILPRKLPEVLVTQDAYDFCVISQPRVNREVRKFVKRLAQHFPKKRIAYCLHPDEEMVKDELLDGSPNIEIIFGGTYNAIAHSEICISGYSTSLYEAASQGKSVYILPVPGWEVVEHGIEEGIFRKIEDIDQIVPFKQPTIANTIF